MFGNAGYLRQRASEPGLGTHSRLSSEGRLLLRVYATLRGSFASMRAGGPWSCPADELGRQRPWD